MWIKNLSKQLSDIPLPSEVLYSTVVIDSSDWLSVDLDPYQKVILVSHIYQVYELSGFAFRFCVGQESLFVGLYEKPNILHDVSFVIQGPLHAHTLYTILYTAPYGCICLGLWESELEEVKQQIERETIDNYYNKYLQIISTLKGLFQVKTPYSIKLRADEYYVNFIPFLTKLKSLQPYQILMSNIYFKKANDWPYHISDHIMGARTEILVSMFSQASKHAKEKTLLKITPEVHLAISFLLQFYPVHPEDRDIQKILRCMYTFFDIFSIFQFESYKVKTVERFITKEDGRIQDINTLEAMSDFQVQVMRS